MKFATFTLLVATAAAVNVRYVPGVKKEDRMFEEEKPKTYIWEKQLVKKTQGKP